METVKSSACHMSCREWDGTGGSIEDFRDSKNTQYAIIMMVMHAIIYLFETSECVTTRVNHNVNCEL